MFPLNCEETGMEH